MRLIDTDLPLIEAALVIYVETIRKDPTLPTINAESAAGRAVFDGIENAQRLLLRTRDAIKLARAAAKQQAAQSASPAVPGVGL